MDVNGSTPFIDVEHEDSLGIFVLLENSRIFSFSWNYRNSSGLLYFPRTFPRTFPRLKGRIIFSCQEINLASEDHIRLSGNIGAIRGVPTDQYNGGALTSVIQSRIAAHAGNHFSRSYRQQNDLTKYLEL